MKTRPGFWILVSYNLRLERERERERDDIENLRTMGSQKHVGAENGQNGQLALKL